MIRERYLVVCDGCRAELATDNRYAVGRIIREAGWSEQERRRRAGTTDAVHLCPACRPERQGSML